MEEKTLVKMLFGAHLYGTATENSDLDYKGVFMPHADDVLLGSIPKCYSTSTKKGVVARNSPDDIDSEFYSLHYFITLALEGQTAAIDMLHAPPGCIIDSSPIWRRIVKNRSKFYTKNLKAFIGYARRQASKYGIRGSRLNAAQEMIALLKSYNADDKLRSLWHRLPTQEHLYHIEKNNNGIEQYQVCGKIIQATQSVGYTLDILEKFYSAYGQRALAAAENKGIDWKAVSHAIRAALQVKELLTDGTITFPLIDAAMLLAVKNGEMDYLTEAAPTLESLMDEVEDLVRKSTLPDKPDSKFWRSFLLAEVRNHVLQP